MVAHETSLERNGSILMVDIVYAETAQKCKDRFLRVCVLPCVVLMLPPAVFKILLCLKYSF